MFTSAFRHGELAEWLVRCHIDEISSSGLDYFGEILEDKARVDFANTLRGLAAASVVIAHYFGVFWLNRAAVESITNTPMLPFDTHAVPVYVAWLNYFSIFNWGAFGVALFFIISGFVIPFSLRNAGFIGFVSSRFFRIFPTYMVGFTLTLLAVWVGSTYYARDWPFTVSEVFIHYFPGARDVLWSRSIDGVVWTLEIEIKFYMLCAVFIGFFRSYSLKVFLIPAALFVIFLCVNRLLPGWGVSNASAWKLGMVYANVSQYVIYMFIGTVFHYLHQAKIGPDRAYFGIGVLFLMFCVHWLIGPYSQNLSVAWSYAFALVFFSFAYSFPALFGSGKVVDFLANISYPMYVVHGVAGYVGLRLLLEKGVLGWVALLLVTSLCILLSWGVHRLIEIPSQLVGRRVARRV